MKTWKRETSLLPNFLKIWPVAGTEYRRMSQGIPDRATQLPAGVGAQPGGGRRPSQRLVAVELSTARLGVGSRIRAEIETTATTESIERQTLEAINQQQLEHPKVPGRRFLFRLAHRSELDLQGPIGTGSILSKIPGN